MGIGDELLIAEGNPAHAAGLKKLFDAKGYVVSAVGSLAEAQDRLTRKYYPVVLVDQDLDRPSGGLQLVREVKGQGTGSTAVIVLSGRRSVDAAIEAFRGGAHDVIAKSRDHVPRLVREVGLACERAKATRDDSVLRESLAVHDEAFGILLTLARVAYHDVSIAATQGLRPRILVVESDTGQLPALGELLGSEDWELTAEMTGGAALDKASSHPFDIVLARDELPDLRGSMVVKTIQAEHAETLGYVYGTPGPEGRVERFEEGRSAEMVRPYESFEDLRPILDAAVQRLMFTARDRRVISHFRAEHPAFFRRYAELKMRLGRLLD
ncbi:MAG: response regulator [Myxococcota bacterium]